MPETKRTTQKIGRHYFKREETRITTDDPEEMQRLLRNLRPRTFDSELGEFIKYAEAILTAAGLPHAPQMYQTAKGWQTDPPPPDEQIGSCSINSYVTEHCKYPADSKEGLAARALSTAFRVRADPDLDDVFTAGRLFERLLAVDFYTDGSIKGKQKLNRTTAAKRQHAVELFHTVKDRSNKGPYVLAAEILEKWHLGPKKPSKDTIIRYLRDEKLIS